MTIAALSCSGRTPAGTPQRARADAAAEPPEEPVELLELSPAAIPGGAPTTLDVKGSGFRPAAEVLLDGVPVSTTFLSPQELAVEVPGLARGRHEVTLASEPSVSTVLALEVGNTPPAIRDPGRLEIDEEARLDVRLEVSDFDGDPLRVTVSGLPPGARFDESSRTLTFEPTFIQGGQSWPVQVHASDGLSQAEVEFELAVADSVSPAPPVVVSTEARDGWTVVRLRQTTDDFLDSPGWAGRSFEAWLVVPSAATAASPKPVQVRLHPIDAEAPGPAVGSRDEFRLYPHDPMNSYWWGYSEGLPAALDGGAVRPYTARRVLHLMEWVLRTYPGADPERVWISGSSMGGAGALAIGLLFARHFSFVEATAAQTVPRHHRPARLETLAGLWGTPQGVLEGAPRLSVWDQLDLTRALAESAETREQFVSVWHGKDDTIITFRAAVTPSPLTGESFLNALQHARAGHRAFWDEGGHEAPDPVLGDDWTGTFKPPDSLRRDRAFPAFSGCSHDRDPGAGNGNGKRPWNDDTGFAGKVQVAGDTGWEGDLAGAINRPLRWDPETVVDTPERFSISLRVEEGSGSGPPRAGYPAVGDRLDGALPVRVDVTPRRTQAFRCMPGERVRWSFGEAAGEVQAGADGAVTVPALSVTAAWTPLVLERAPLR